MYLCYIPHFPAWLTSVLEQRTSVLELCRAVFKLVKKLEHSGCKKIPYKAECDSSSQIENLS